MIKSPLRYPGGKSKIIKILDQHIPSHKELREPFFGGGSLSIFVAQRFNSKIIASDLNYELYCFWKILKENKDELYSSVLSIYNKKYNGKQLYSEIINRRNDDKSELDRAIDFFILNRITFSGIADAGGYSEESFNKRFTKSSIDRLYLAGLVIRDFKFYYKDYENLFNQDENVFIFADPPYYSVKKSKLYGKDGILHLSFDHDRLFNVISNSKHKIMLTYDNCEYIRTKYKDFNIIPIEFKYSMNSFCNKETSIGKELIIKNY